MFPHGFLKIIHFLFHFRLVETQHNKTTKSKNSDRIKYTMDILLTSKLDKK